MYRITFDVIVENPDDAYRVQDYLRRTGMYVERYNMEAIHDDVMNIHTMDGQMMSVRGVPEAPRPVRRVAREYADLIKRHENDELLRELLETEGRHEEKTKDFLDEKDMEL